MATDTVKNQALTELFLKELARQEVEKFNLLIQMAIDAVKEELIASILEEKGSQQEKKKLEEFNLETLRLIQQKTAQEKVLNALNTAKMPSFTFDLISVEKKLRSEVIEPLIIKYESTLKDVLGEQGENLARTLNDLKIGYQFTKDEALEMQSTVGNILVERTEVDEQKVEKKLTDMGIKPRPNMNAMLKQVAVVAGAKAILEEKAEAKKEQVETVNHPTPPLSTIKAAVKIEEKASSEIVRNLEKLRELELQYMLAIVEAVLQNLLKTPGVTSSDIATILTPEFLKKIFERKPSPGQVKFENIVRTLIPGADEKFRQREDLEKFIRSNPKSPDFFQDNVSKLLTKYGIFSEPRPNGKKVEEQEEQVEYSLPTASPAA